MTPMATVGLESAMSRFLARVPIRMWAQAPANFEWAPTEYFDIYTRIRIVDSDDIAGV